MKKTKLILIFILFVTKILAQAYNVDTMYFKSENGFLISCHRKFAEGFSVPNPFNPNSYIYKIRYLQSETPLAEYEAYDKKIINNKNSVSATYPVKNGKWLEWYNSGDIKISCFYSEDKLNGDFKVFYPNGILKRFEKWTNGEWTSGECYDENGNKIQYCSYQETAEFIGGLSELYKFIGETIRYPKHARKNSIEGVVYVSFIIDTDGFLTDVTIRKGVDQYLDEEALRIVNAMPKWKPGKFEGSLVKTTFVLPLRFKLE